MPFLFEKLEVYQRALTFADEITSLCEGFPKGNYFIVDQLNRAALSISCNIAEGNGRFHKADRQNFFRIARGSACEYVPLLELCSRKNLIAQPKSQKLKSELDEISKMITGLIK